MNKELIKQYKAEFDHWLNGGKVISLFRFKGNEIYQWSLPSNGKDDCCGPFLTVNDMTEYKAIIICDDYIEFRKALAEGKTIQYQSIEVLEFGRELEVWKDINPANIAQYHISLLRIKPDRAQLKVGDWCLDTRDNQLKQIVNPESPVVCAYYKLWQPQPNEWCVFWETDVTTYTVARFHSRSKRGAYITVYGHDFYNIAPLEFIQTLKD